jgi:hypothetical protein
LLDWGLHGEKSLTVVLFETMRVPARLRYLVVACSIAGVFVAARDACAEGVSPVEASGVQRKEATDHFIAGKRAMASKDWEKAVSELRASLEIVDSPNTRLELARALRDSGELSAAWVQYWQAAQTATRLAPKDERYAKAAEAATNEREEVAQKLAFVEVIVAHAPADMTLRVGGRVVAPEESGAPVAVAPGPVEVVVVSSAGVELARSTVTASMGTTTSASLDAQPTPAASGAGETDAETSDAAGSVSDRGPLLQASPSPLTSDRAMLRPYAYVAGGIGLAGFVTFAVFGALAGSTYSDLKGACPHGCPAGKQGEIDSGITQQTVANVGLGVGIAGLAAGTTLFFLSRSAKPSGAAAAMVVSGDYRGAYVGVRGHL